ncbi:putative TauD/TfdA-like domain-containing protein [Seiridium cardinale]
MSDTSFDLECGADVGAIALRAVVFGIRAAYPELDLAELAAQAKIPFQNTGCSSPTQTHVRERCVSFSTEWVPISHSSRTPRPETRTLASVFVKHLRIKAVHGDASPQAHISHLDEVTSAGYGFMLFYVAPDVLNESNKDYKNSWILTDMHSEKWADVYELFVRANPDGPKYSKEIRFTDETETVILRKTVNEKTGPVSGMELSSLYGHCVDWFKVDDYYVKCKAACAEIEVALSMDASGCPEFQESLRSKASSGQFVHDYPGPGLAILPDGLSQRIEAGQSVNQFISMNSKDSMVS